MKIELVNTGTELLLGSVLNTHLAFVGESLFGLGLRLERQVSVPDGPAIAEALRESWARGAEVVLVTGGLGPTSDDLTRDVAAALLGRALSVDPAVLATVQAYHAARGQPVINERIARQAQVPVGATVLPNRHGTAPGLYLPAADRPPSADDGAGPGPRPGGPSPHLFLLPGPPRELRPMFTEEVLPRLRALRPPGQTPPGVRLYRLVGIGESWVEERVEPALREIVPALEIGYCAHVGDLDLRCIGPEEALARADAVVRALLGEHLLSAAGESRGQVAVRLLRAAGRTLAVAESCTGGLLAHLVTNVPGASEVFLAGLTTYANEAKRALLGVPAELLARHGAVSEPVAAAMAAGARRAAGADYALATTGVAGPGGGSAEKPVGTVYVALAGPAADPPRVRRHFFPTDRETFKQRAAQAAFDLLWRELEPAAAAPESRS